MSVHLVVPFDASWETQPGSSHSTTIVPFDSDAIIALVTPVLPLPVVADAEFFRRTLSLDLPVGSTLTIDGSTEGTTRGGWPVSLLRATVSTDACIVEHRVGAFYRFLEEYALLLFRCRAPWQELPPRIAELVIGADLDWSGPPACLAETLGIEPDDAVFSS